MRQGSDVAGAVMEMRRLIGRRVVVTLAVGERPLCRFAMTLEDVDAEEELTLSGDYMDNGEAVHYSEANVPIPEEDGFVHWTTLGDEGRVETSEDVQMVVAPL